MRKTALFLIMIALAVPAAADTLSIGSRVLTDGDSTGKVYELLGKPDRIVEHQNRFGAVVGERFEYYDDGKTIQIEIRDGIVESIDEEI